MFSTVITGFVLLKSDYIYLAEKIGDAEVLEVHVAAQDHVQDPPPQHTESVQSSQIFIIGNNCVTVFFVMTIDASMTFAYVLNGCF